ncbi:S8/S53 family peptidase [Actinoplanes sp. NEAU-A12]|uniref:S8/S53 family peptidase n=1 Tax=Actinoplanes sandaracinus TaxID=3045177 RepID=A0ABT6WZ97_9ACTN|nr:S8/S53 family peptidase [Actinoplanes sandaracinus]MDI6104931.1 S8/S53 family peptidase [Actinoplanes sandaracinus]
MAFPVEPTHLVVAQPHLGPLLTALDEARERSGDTAGPWYAAPRTSDVLGLALVPLPDPERVAAGLRTWVSPGRPAEPEQGGPALDRVLRHLRAGFASRYFGWTPLLGKNRLVGRIHGPRRPSGVSGAGEVSHGGGGAPRAITPPSWATGRTAVTPGGVTVGLVDTAMVNHDYLAGAWTGPFAAAAEGRPADAEGGHATFIAGLIHRHAPAATVRVHPVLDGAGDADVWTAAHRIVEAGRAGADVLNLSFVCYTEDGGGPLVLATALERLGRDTVVVAAAGNHGHLKDGQDHRPAFPAAFPNVIAVGATDAPYSAKGPWITVLAPGTDLESTYLSGAVSVWEDPDGEGPAPAGRHDQIFHGYARWSGTSFAAAVVSAMIADRTVPGRVRAAEASARLLGPALLEGKPVRLDPRDAPA